MAALFLQVRAGPLHLMLDAGAIREVLTRDVGTAVDARQAQWRGDVLPVIPLAGFLGFAGELPEIGVVYALADGLPPVMFGVDEVIGLRPAGTSSWRSTPRLPREAAALFDAVYVDAARELLAYRLRAGLDPSRFGLLGTGAEIAPAIGTLPAGA